MTQQKQTQVTIYTDGSCIGNPGPGGYGAVLMADGRRREISGGFRRTTNNRMEILAAVVALESLKRPCRVTLHSDSRYVVDAMTKGWVKRWQANDWRRNKREAAVNPDLWERMLRACDPHNVEFRWVPGHAGVPENERCDRLAVEAAKQKDLPEDTGYKPASSRPVR